MLVAITTVHNTFKTSVKEPKICQINIIWINQWREQKPAVDSLKVQFDPLRTKLQQVHMNLTLTEKVNFVNETKCNWNIPADTDRSVLPTLRRTWGVQQRALCSCAADSGQTFQSNLNLWLLLILNSGLKDCFKGTVHSNLTHPLLMR